MSSVPASSTLGSLTFCIRVLLSRIKHTVRRGLEGHTEDRTVYSTGLGLALALWRACWERDSQMGVCWLVSSAD